MTVKELITELSKFDLDEEVVIAGEVKYIKLNPLNAIDDLNVINDYQAVRTRKIEEVRPYQIRGNRESKVLLS